MIIFAVWKPGDSLLEYHPAISMPMRGIFRDPGGAVRLEQLRRYPVCQPCAALLSVVSDGAVRFSGNGQWQDPS